jgi:outer membrane protein OmpA-like peptidoglycan-associated protein
MVGAYRKQTQVCRGTTETCLELNRRVEILAVR